MHQWCIMNFPKIRKWLHRSQTGLSYQPPTHHCKPSSQRVQLHTEQLLPRKRCWTKDHPLVLPTTDALFWREPIRETTKPKKNTHKNRSHAYFWSCFLCHFEELFFRETTNRAPQAFLAWTEHEISVTEHFILKRGKRRQCCFSEIEEQNFLALWQQHFASFLCIYRISSRG